MLNLVDLFWLSLLAVTAAWSSFFSLFNRQHIRGWRNLGLLAGYAAGIAMFVALPWRQAFVTWGVMGVGAGVLYIVYQLVAYLGLAERSADAKPRIGRLIHGLFLWPIMMPEAVEYLLAEMGVLKAASSTTSGT